MLGGLMHSIWARARPDASGKPTEPEATPNAETSDVDAVAEPGGRPKSKSFNGGNVPPGVTTTTGTGSTGFFSKLTPLIPAQLMRAGAKTSSGPGTAVEEPVSAPVPESSTPAHHSHHRRRRHRHHHQHHHKANPPTVLHMLDSDVQVPLGGTVPDQSTDEISHGGGGDGGDDDDDGDDDDGDSHASDASWDGLDDVYTPSPSGPSAVDAFRRRSNSDAGSVHSALSVTNLVGRYDQKEHTHTHLPHEHATDARACVTFRRDP